METRLQLAARQRFVFKQFGEHQLPYTFARCLPNLLERASFTTAGQMANQYYPQPQSQSYNPQNLQFYQSSYPQPVSGHTTPSQAHYGYTNSQPQASQAYSSSSGGFGGAPTFGGQGFGGPSVSGRMGEQGGLRTGWLAAFGTEGYDGEPPLLEELGVNFGHIKGKVCRKP